MTLVLPWEFYSQSTYCSSIMHHIFDHLFEKCECRQYLWIDLYCQRSHEQSSSVSLLWCASWLYPLAGNAAVWVAGLGVPNSAQLCSGNSQSPARLKSQRRTVHLENYIAPQASCTTVMGESFLSSEIKRLAGEFHLIHLKSEHFDQVLPRSNICTSLK